jgi:hypothetical protein
MPKLQERRARRRCRGLQILGRKTELNFKGKSNEVHNAA